MSNCIVLENIMNKKPLTESFIDVVIDYIRKKRASKLDKKISKNRDVRQAVKKLDQAYKDLDKAVKKWEKTGDKKTKTDYFKLFGVK